MNMSNETNTRLQAKFNEGVTEVKALIKHPMETGQTKDLETGKLIPAHFIEEISCEHNGEVVMFAQWGIGISANPYLAFQFEGGKVGDKVKLTWKDNQGQSETTVTEIIPK
jgi:sulfur-oxidizing protein SoxZ